MDAAGDAAATDGRPVASFDQRFPELFALAMRPAWRLLSDRHEAENVAAEVLARALVRWRSLGASPTLPGWIVTVSTNLSIQHLRKTRRPPARLPGRGGDGPSIDARLDLVDAMLGLPRRQREAITLRYFLDQSEADIASTLGISVSSVKTHLQRGLRGLRRQLEDLTEVSVGVE
jgi:DNA-directed RNA polymerase specialized sigma24 family protein